MIRNYQDEQVTLIGHNNGSHYAHAISVSAPWVTIHGLTVQADPDMAEDRDKDFIVFLWSGAQHAVLSCLDIEVPGDWQSRFNSTPRHRVGGVKIDGINSVSDILIEGCKIEHIPFQAIAVESTHVTIRGNTVKDYVSNSVMMQVGGTYENRAPRHVVIEHNWFGGSLVSDGIQTNSYDETAERGGYLVREFVIRNNVFHGFAENAIDLKGSRKVLIEGNIIQGSEGDNDGRVFGAVPDRTGSGSVTHGSGQNGDHWIVRKNIIYDNTSGVAMSWPTYNLSIYNNTIVANGRDFTGPDSDYAWTNIAQKPNFTGTGGCPQADTLLRNNIIGQHNHVEVWVNLGCQNLDIDHNLYFNTAGAQFLDHGGDNRDSHLYNFDQWKAALAGFSGISGNDNHSMALSHTPGFVRVPERPVGDHAGYDFRITRNSDARNTGGPLTTTATTGRGNTIRVANAHPFYDGFDIPGEQGDEIVVGSAGTVQIVHIDYETGAVTVDREIAWSAGDPVFLGPFEGAAPDIGALEYKSAQPVSTECNDGRDNDNDGLTDLSDDGCTSAEDNDESDCGDGVCEGSELCDACIADCGACQAPQPLQPLSHWRLDDGSGATADDTEGNNDGTIHGASWTEGILGDALHFDGIDDYVGLAAPIRFTNEDAYTISFWLNVDDVDQFAGIFGPETTWEYFITLDSDERLSFYDNDNHFRAGQLTPGHWYHAVLVSDGNNLTWYLDGEQVNQSADFNNAISIAAMGTQYAGADIRFAGTLDDVRIFDRALSLSEVSDLQSGNPPDGGTDPTDPPDEPPVTCEDECHQAQTYQCSADGTAVDVCEADASGCLAWRNVETCPTGGSCDTSTDSPACVCPIGYHEDNTNSCVADAICQPETCSGNGTCNDTGGVLQCDCNSGYAGVDCSGCAPGYAPIDGSCEPASSGGGEAPVVFWPKPVRAHPGMPFEFGMVAYDPEADVMHFSLEGAPDGMQIDPTGVIHWQPDFGGADSVEFTIVVSDGVHEAPPIPVQLRNAADEFVFVSPNAPSSGNGTLDSPYNNLDRAMSALAAMNEGTLVMRGGSYNVTWANDNLNSLAGAQGSADAPFEIIAYSGETPVVNCLANSRGFAFGASSAYVRLRGIEIANASRGERGGLVVYTHHVVADHVTVRDSNWNASNNCTGFYLAGVENVCYRCRGLDNYDRQVRHQWNSSNFITYADKGSNASIYLLYCYSRNSKVGYKIKHSGGGKVLVHGSLDENSDYGWFGLDSDSVVQHSVFMNNKYAFELNCDPDESASNRDLSLIHNTAIHPSLAAIEHSLYSTGDLKFLYNIFTMDVPVGGPPARPHFTLLMPYRNDFAASMVQADYNCWYAPQDNNGYRLGRANIVDFAGWTSLGLGAHSRFGDPNLDANYFPDATSNCADIEGVGAGPGAVRFDFD